MKSVFRFVAIYFVLSAGLGAVALVSSFPARPGSWLGWLGLFALVVPLTLVGEYVGESLHRNPVARAVVRRTQGKHLSWLRLGYLLAIGLVVGAAVVSINLVF